MSAIVAMSTAVSAVFNTVELLENILVYLPTTTLARSRGTCRRFSDVVGDSILLQPKLFLKPESTKLYLQWTPQIGTKMYEPIVLSSSQLDAAGTAQHSMLTYPIAKLHPGLDDGKLWDARTTLSVSVDLRKMLSWPPGGQWREMLITQPPARSIVIRYASSNTQVCRGIAYIKTTLTDEGGIRLGAILPALRRAMPAKERTNGIGYRNRDLDDVVHYRICVIIDRFVKDSSPWVARAQNQTRERASVESLRGGQEHAVEPWNSSDYNFEQGSAPGRLKNWLRAEDLRYSGRALQKARAWRRKAAAATRHRGSFDGCARPVAVPGAVLLQ